MVMLKSGIIFGLGAAVATGMRRLQVTAINETLPELDLAEMAMGQDFLCYEEYDKMKISANDVLVENPDCELPESASDCDPSIWGACRYLTLMGPPKFLTFSSEINIQNEGNVTGYKPVEGEGRNCESITVENPPTGDVSVDVSMPYYVFGNGENGTVVLLPGMGQLALDSDPNLLLALSKKFRVIVTDYPGIGRSDVTSTTGEYLPLLPIKNVAELMNQFLSKLAERDVFQEKPALIGAAWGTRVASYMVQLDKDSEQSYKAVVMLSGGVNGQRGGGGSDSRSSALDRLAGCKNGFFKLSTGFPLYTSHGQRGGCLFVRHNAWAGGREELLHGNLADRQRQAAGLLGMDRELGPTDGFYSADVSVPTLMGVGAFDKFFNPCGSLCGFQRATEANPKRRMGMVAVEGAHYNIMQSIENVVEFATAFINGETEDPLGGDFNYFEKTSQLCSAPEGNYCGTESLGYKDVKHACSGRTFEECARKAITITTNTCSA